MADGTVYPLPTAAAFPVARPVEAPEVTAAKQALVRAHAALRSAYDDWAHELRGSLVLADGELGGDFARLIAQAELIYRVAEGSVPALRALSTYEPQKNPHQRADGSDPFGHAVKWQDAPVLYAAEEIAEALTGLSLTDEQSRVLVRAIRCAHAQAVLDGLTKPQPPAPVAARMPVAA